MTFNKSAPNVDLNAVLDSDADDVDEEVAEPGGRRIGDIYIPPPPPKPAFSGDSTGTRLVITRIENFNFKSYYGRQVLGPFHKSFTSIVGPNGSGKSNVIDSMLFVFGYRAQKLRSKKLSILIHSSENYPNLDHCRVTVHFSLINDQGGDDFEMIDGSQFTVSRTAHKDNSAYYSINDKKVKFTDVSLLLQSHGIDLKYNRFLILQGEVEQIALMKPKADNEGDSGMLEFLEDIIGSTRLKKPLSQLTKKVEESNEVRSEKMNRVKVVEKELKSLEEAKNEAVRFLETENGITIEKSKLYHLEMSEASEEKAEAEKDYNRANDIFQKAVEEINALKKDREDREEENKEMSKNYTIINKKSEELNQKYKDFEKRDVQLRETLKNTKAKGKKLETSLESENNKLTDLESLPQKHSEDIELLTAKKEQMDKDMAVADEHLTTVMGEIKRDTEPLQKRKDEIEKQLLELQKGVNEARSQMEISQSELDIYLSREQNEKAKLEQLKLKLEKSVDDARDKMNALERLNTEIPGDENKLQELNNKMAEILRQKENMVKDFNLHNEKLIELKNRATDTTSRNKVLNALMEQKRNGTLKGIFGRLGDLGAIDPKFDVAVSTACGPLDNIVMDTIDNAQKCVDFLKHNNIGTATFIVLEKLRVSWRDGETFPENVQRLFDLVRVKDDRMRNAFYFALRDTLVVENLDQASRIAYGKRRFRVVTLTGDLIEIQGTMAGGGRASSGRMGSSVAVSDVDEREIQTLEVTVAQLRNDLTQLKSEYDGLRIEIDRLSADLNIMRKNKPQFEMEVKHYDELQNALKISIREQEDKVKSSAPDPQRVKELKNKYNVEKNKYELEAKKTSQFEDEVDSLNEKIKEIMDKKVGSARRKVETLKEQINKINSDLAKANVAIKTAHRNIEKCKERIKQLETEKQEAIDSLASIREDLKKLEEEATIVSADYEAAINERDAQTEKIKELQTKIGKIKSQENRLNNENVDAKHEVEQQLVKLKQREAEVKKWMDALSQLKLHEIEGKDKVAIPQLSKEDVEQLSRGSLKKEIESLEKDLKKMKPNMAAIEEFKKKEAVFLERAKQLEDITKQRDMYKSQYEEIRAQRLSEFKDGFLTIARKLKEMYRMITMGGDAELEYIDSLDPFSEGVTFAVRPNKKSWKKISNLSGGEKTLSSLALIFALHFYKPSPLYVMDEIDAALDFKNVSIVANYIKQRTRNTQFIIISLRNNMYELADRLVGIYKTFHCTKSVTINPTKIEERKADRKTVSLSSCSTTPPKESTVSHKDSQQTPKHNDNIAEEHNYSIFVD